MTPQQRNPALWLAFIFAAGVVASCVLAFW